MTTFKNNAKYGELILTYLDLAIRDDVPLTVPEVLQTFRWRFKGGSLQKTSQSTRLKPVTSRDVYPDGLSELLANSWPWGEDCEALRVLLYRRARVLRKRSVEALLGTWMMLTSSYGNYVERPVIYSGMKAVYYVFGQLWEWAKKPILVDEWEVLASYTRELALAGGGSSMMHVPTCEAVWKDYWQVLSSSRVPMLLKGVAQIKEVLKVLGGKEAMLKARHMGREERAKWEHREWDLDFKGTPITDLGIDVLTIMLPLGDQVVRISQQCMLYLTGGVRFAFSMSDTERLHQLVMSTASCIVGAAAQAVVGTSKQKMFGSQVLTATQDNIQRVVDSSAKVALGDEVLVCKGYRRAYTAHLGVLAGPLCLEETKVLVREAEETAPPGVLDITGYMASLGQLDAAGSLNAGKVFKICPAPDVSPGSAMLDRVAQIGNCNVFDPTMTEQFRDELRGQILRAYIRGAGHNLKPRDQRPLWYMDYLRKDYDKVPTMEIHQYLEWEGTAKMPDMSPYDPAHWKDSGLGADTIRESEVHHELGNKKNMLTRLLFDSECPMPGRLMMTEDHVIKFFVKAEGHKDPARGIFSANLMDRQAQSWMEVAVERVAKKHPSFMIGAPVDVRDLKVKELTARPKDYGWVALYYSFDISGWSAKMPAEPQRISHSIWADLYGGHLFKRAHEVNEGAHIYLALEGYEGWYKNTASNLEGFNGKEMTMVLVALLSLSVRRWRERAIEAELLTREEAESTTALLFAYIDDGLSRIDLPARVATAAFSMYKECVIETFSRCGFTVETSKCFPSDRFSIFLNEVYLAGRHVVHGVRAAMGISSEPTERHTTLIERTSSVATGCRGAVMAGLHGFSATLLMAYHVFLHLREWTSVRDPVVLAVWSVTPRSWGGLGLPNMFQMTSSGSGAAFEEGVATLQSYAGLSTPARVVFLNLCRTELEDRSASSVLTAPLSCRVKEGYMVDSRVASMVRDALAAKLGTGELSPYASRLLKYADHRGFESFAEAVVPMNCKETLQEQMLVDVFESHPHSIFSTFARRVEKSVTVSAIVGKRAFPRLLTSNREEAKASVEAIQLRMRGILK